MSSDVLPLDAVDVDLGLAAAILRHVVLVATLPGDPQQQGSKRPLGPGRPFIEMNRNLAPWRADAVHYLQAAAREQWGPSFGVPLTDPVRVEATFVYARPKGHYGTGRNAGRVKDGAPTYKTSAPDLDKLQRALGDALTQAGVVRDDALIVSWSTSKQWGPCSQIIVRVMRVS